MKKLLTTLTILLIATASCTSLYSDAVYVTVERVIDGDTIVVTTQEGKSEKVHLIGIDAPESKDNDKARRDAQRTGQDVETINKMGQEATEFVKGLIKPGQEVRLEFDVQEKDKYGRLLAYITYNAGTNKLYHEGSMIKMPDYFEAKLEKELLSHKGVYFNFLNASIIKAGYATPMTIPPNVKYADLFKKLYEEARENKRGLWR